MSENIKMPPTLATLRKQQAAILELTTKYGVSNVRVFGSVARDEATLQSDIDLLVDFPPRFSLLDLSSLVQDLQSLLGCPVQVTSADHLREEMRPSILADIRPL
jgi:predicted nucleotidyltransferase